MLQEDGLLKRSGFSQADRQLLEDALFGLNLQLADEAVAAGVPLLLYRHPQAKGQLHTLPRCRWWPPLVVCRALELCTDCMAGHVHCRARVMQGSLSCSACTTCKYQRIGERGFA